MGTTTSVDRCWAGRAGARVSLMVGLTDTIGSWSWAPRSIAAGLRRRSTRCSNSSQLVPGIRGGSPLRSCGVAVGGAARHNRGLAITSWAGTAVSPAAGMSVRRRTYVGRSRALAGPMALVSRTYSQRHAVMFPTRAHGGARVLSETRWRCGNGTQLDIVGSRSGVLRDGALTAGYWGC